MNRVLGLVALSVFGLAACMVEPGVEGEDGTSDSDVSDISSVSQGKAIMPVKGFVSPTGNVATAGTNGISYQGGPVMSSGVNVYYIWYGAWANTAATTEPTDILTDMAKSMGGSPYFNINTTYTGVQNVVTYKGAVYDNYSQGTTAAKKKLADTTIYNIVKRAITTAAPGGFGGTADPNGLYFVLTSADVTASSGFCTKYCGWHSSSVMDSSTAPILIGGVNVKYSFVGNPDKCPSSCAALTVSPNGNAGADGMASIITHELEEAATDPDGTGWWDTATGMENADKCAWTFGTVYTAPNGAKANVHLGARDYYIQQNWVNSAGGSCKMSF
jgi:hypothetical protein